MSGGATKSDASTGRVSGRKRGRPKTAGSMDEAIYGRFATRPEGLNPEFDAAFIVQDTFLRLGERSSDPEDWDDNQLESRALWINFVGGLVVRALLQKDHAFFADISAILEKNPPDDEGGWHASAPELVEAFALAGQNPSIAPAEYVEKLAGLQSPFGDKRRTNARRAKAAGIPSRPRGRPKKEK